MGDEVMYLLRSRAKAPLVGRGNVMKGLRILRSIHIMYCDIMPFRGPAAVGIGLAYLDLQPPPLQLSVPSSPSEREDVLSKR